MKIWAHIVESTRRPNELSARLSLSDEMATQLITAIREAISGEINNGKWSAGDCVTIEINVTPRNSALLKGRL